MHANVKRDIIQITVTVLVKKRKFNLTIKVINFF